MFLAASSLCCQQYFGQITCIFWYILHTWISVHYLLNEGLISGVRTGQVRDVAWSPSAGRTGLPAVIEQFLLWKITIAEQIQTRVWILSESESPQMRRESLEERGHTKQQHAGAKFRGREGKVDKLVSLLCPKFKLLGKLCLWFSSP